MVFVDIDPIGERSDDDAAEPLLQVLQPLSTVSTITTNLTGGTLSYSAAGRTARRTMGTITVSPLADSDQHVREVKISASGRPLISKPST